jgi:serine/threonine protein kinase
MGTVYLARNESLGSRVAVKFLAPHLLNQPSLAERFRREGKASVDVAHANAIQLLDAGTEGSQLYLVFEYAEGEDLRTVLDRERTLPLSDAVQIAVKVAEVLSVAHARGIVHRDIKPENLRVRRDLSGYQVKVLDFGVARVRDSQKLVPRQTQVGQVVGTPLWMSPEQVLGHDVDAKTDVYALATVLYVLLVKHYPFEGATPQQVVMKRLQVAATAIGDTTFGGEPIPRALQKLVMRALSRDVAPRPTMGELVTALREFEAEPVFEAIDLELESGRGRWRWLLSPLVPIAAGAAWWLLRAHH